MRVQREGGCRAVRGGTSVAQPNRGAYWGRRSDATGRMGEAEACFVGRAAGGSDAGGEGVRDEVKPHYQVVDSYTTTATATATARSRTGTRWLAVSIAGTLHSRGVRCGE